MAIASAGTFFPQAARRRVRRLLLTWPLLGVLGVAGLALARSVSPLLLNRTATTPLLLLGASVGGAVVLFGFVAAAALALRWAQDVLLRPLTWLLGALVMGAAGVLYANGMVDRGSVGDVVGGIQPALNALVTATDSAPAATVAYVALPLVFVLALVASLWAVQMEPRQFAARRARRGGTPDESWTPSEDSSAKLAAGAPWAELERGNGMHPVKGYDQTTEEFFRGGDQNSVIMLTTQELDGSMSFEAVRARDSASRWRRVGMLLVAAVGIAAWLVYRSH